MGKINTHFGLKMEQIWILTKKNLDLYFKKGPVIIFGLLFPFFMALAWIVGRTIEPVQIFCGVLGMAVFFISTAISPVVFPWETREKNLERILSAPVTLFDLVTSIILASSLFSIIISSIVCIVLLLALNISFSVFIWFILGTILLSWASSSLGVLIAAPPTDMTSNIMTLSTLIKFPLIFISGIFISLSALSPVFFVLALFSPITYYVDLLKSSLGAGSLGVGIDLAALAIWAILLFLFAYLVHKKTILKRF
ncbi:MAG: ABC transporter permease [Candidatus Helarchaeota archaeon]